jgi:RNA polymerase sigma factor for flagellar operon FliA
MGESAATAPMNGAVRMSSGKTSKARVLAVQRAAVYDGDAPRTENGALAALRVPAAVRREKAREGRIPARNPVAITRFTPRVAAGGSRRTAAAADDCEISVDVCKPERSSANTDSLVMRHAELVKRIAYHLAGRLPASVEVADLIQAGMLGLIEAASNYTADRGASFETYAGIRIRGAMLDALRKLDWAPRSVHRKARAAAAAVRAIETEFGREARDGEIAEHMGVTLEQYHRIAQDAATCRIASLDVGGSDEDPLLAQVEDDKADPFLGASEEGFREALTRAIGVLPERERMVMSMYYDDELNLKEIGAVLKVTESRVCQLHGQALMRLKARLADWRDRGDTTRQSDKQEPGRTARREMNQ